MKQKRAALYVRVSSGEQHTEMQERALREYVQRRAWVLHKIYRDKCTGATASRPGLEELLKDCRHRSIDVVVVWKFDRFARSLKNLIAGLELCRALGIDFVSVTEAVDTSLPAGEMLFQMIGAVAQFERSLIDRTREVRSGERSSEWQDLGPTSLAQTDAQGNRGLEKATYARKGYVQNLGQEIWGCRCGQPTDCAQDVAASEVDAQATHVPSQYNGLAIHRWVLNRLENILLYSSFQRVTKRSI